MSEDRRNREAHRAARQQAYEDAALYHQVMGDTATPDRVDEELVDTIAAEIESAAEACREPGSFWTHDFRADARIIIALVRGNDGH